MSQLLSFFDKAFAQNLIASLVYSLFLLAVMPLRDYAIRRWWRYDVRGTRPLIIAVVLPWILGVVCLEVQSQSAAIFFLAGGIGASIVLWREAAHFPRVGLFRADRSVAGGLGYDEALGLCQNELSFLGLGAAKLTTAKGFEEAIRRCNRPNTPIRFLLSRPDNPILVDAAVQNKKPNDAYQKEVENSLKRIADLKLSGRQNVEIRFYPSHRYLPLFRLMFVNGTICIVSYYVFGEGDGSQLPQLIVRRFDDQRDVESFYHAFRLYYEKLWEESSPWDGSWPVAPAAHAKP